MKVYQIEIHAATEFDAELALEEVRKAILAGYDSAPWDSDGAGNGFSFTKADCPDHFDDSQKMVPLDEIVRRAILERDAVSPDLTSDPVKSDVFGPRDLPRPASAALAGILAGKGGAS
jgi:hypothetical protein